MISDATMAALKRGTEDFHVSAVEQEFDLGQLALSCRSLCHQDEVEHGHITVHDACGVRFLIEEIERLRAAMDLAYAALNYGPDNIARYGSGAWEDAMAAIAATKEKP